MTKQADRAHAYSRTGGAFPPDGGLVLVIGSQERKVTGAQNFFEVTFDALEDVCHGPERRPALVAVAVVVAMIAGLVIVGLTASLLGVHAVGGADVADSTAIALGILTITMRVPAGKQSPARTYVAAVNARALLLVTLAVVAQAVVRLVQATAPVHGVPILMARWRRDRGIAPGLGSPTVRRQCSDGVAGAGRRFRGAAPDLRGAARPALAVRTPPPRHSVDAGRASSGPGPGPLVRRLIADRSVPAGVRIRLGLLLVYLVSPIDLVPDFIPVIGYADDAVIVALVPWSGAGRDALARNWPGTPQGLQLLEKLAGLP